MSYTPQAWADNDPSKPVSAARVTYIETGLAAVASTADAAQTSAAAALSASTNPQTIAQMPAGITLTVVKDAVTGWPVRPTARADIVVAWKGADPSPAIVNSGTGGMLNNVDYRLVTP